MGGFFGGMILTGGAEEKGNPALPVVQLQAKAFFTVGRYTSFLPGASNQKHRLGVQIFNLKRRFLGIH